jgi:hypothetical protein
LVEREQALSLQVERLAQRACPKLFELQLSQHQASPVVTAPDPTAPLRLAELDEQDAELEALSEEAQQVWPSTWSAECFLPSLLVCVSETSTLPCARRRRKRQPTPCPARWLHSPLRLQRTEPAWQTPQQVSILLLSVLAS